MQATGFKEIADALRKYKQEERSGHDGDDAASAETAKPIKVLTSQGSVSSFVFSLSFFIPFLFNHQARSARSTAFDNKRLLLLPSPPQDRFNLTWSWIRLVCHILDLSDKHLRREIKTRNYALSASFFASSTTRVLGLYEGLRSVQRWQQRHRRECCQPTAD